MQIITSRNQARERTFLTQCSLNHNHKKIAIISLCKFTQTALQSSLFVTANHFSTSILLKEQQVKKWQAKVCGLHFKLLCFPDPQGTSRSRL